MEQRLSPIRSYLSSILFLVIIGWGGLVLLFVFSLPTVWPRWLFFILWFMALTGTALPATWFLNLRFSSTPPVGDAVPIRQALWVGGFGAALAWLQLGHVLSLWITVILALGLGVIEYLIRMRERSRWQPPSPVSPEIPGNGAATDDKPS